MQTVQTLQKYVSGSAAFLVSKGVMINGNLLDANGISALSRLGIAQIVGQADKPNGKRGRAGNVFRIEESENVKISLKA